MKKEKGHDYSNIIIWSSAFVGMIRYAAAFLSSDLGQIPDGWLSESVTVALGISGVAMGLLGTLGTTYIFDGWRKKMPPTGERWSSKFIALTVFVFSAMVAEVLILVPFTMSRVLHISVADVLHGGVWWWAGAVVVMPFLLIGGVSVSNQIVTVASGQPTGQMSEPTGQKTDNNFDVTDWRQAKKKLTETERAEIAKMKTSDICFRYGIPDRTARRWRTSAQKETTR